MNIIGCNLIRIRKLRGFSQAYIADKLFVSQQAVDKWERGLSIPQADRIPEIASVLGCKASDLITDREYTHAVPLNENPGRLLLTDEEFTEFCLRKKLCPSYTPQDYLEELHFRDCQLFTT